MRYTKTEKGFNALWIFINAALQGFSNNWYFEFRDWYPINNFRKAGSGILTNTIETNINFDPFWSYDLSEFFIYTSLPIIVYFIYKCLKSKVS